MDAAHDVLNWCERGTWQNVSSQAHSTSSTTEQLFCQPVQATVEALACESIAWHDLPWPLSDVLETQCLCGIVPKDTPVASHTID
jgi:hypothetical protein